MHTHHKAAQKQGKRNLEKEMWTAGFRKMEAAAQDRDGESSGLWLMLHWERQDISQVSHKISGF